MRFNPYNKMVRDVFVTNPLTSICQSYSKTSDNKKQSNILIALPFATIPDVIFSNIGHLNKVRYSREILEFYHLISS